MSELPCSFLLIRVECLSSRAQAQARAEGEAQQHHHHHHHCSFPMPMQIPSNVSAPVLIYVDLCLMSQLPCSVLIQLWTDGADIHNQYNSLVQWKELQVFLRQEHYSVHQYITLVKGKELQDERCPTAEDSAPGAEFN